MTHRLYIRPVFWSAKFELKGYTSNGKSVYIQIPKYTTHVLTFPTAVTPDIVRHITRLLDPLKIQTQGNQITLRSLEKNISLSEDIQVTSDGSLHALFESTQIEPYHWIAIDRYAPLIAKFDFDLNLSVSELDLCPSMNIDTLIQPTLAFWFPHFTDDHQLKAIGIRTVRSSEVNTYLITTESILHPPDGTTITRVDSEAKIWAQGLQLLRLFNPDYIVGWDHGVYPDMSNEYIDLKSYFRRFYPYFQDYRLEILADRFIPATPFGPVRQMYELWNELSIWNRLTNSSNRLRMPITLAHKIQFPMPSFFQAAAPGIYHDVLVYDYTNLYRKVMTQSSDPRVRQVGKRLKYAPSDLVLRTFYQQPSHLKLESRLNHLINQLKKKYRLISILQTTIRSTQPIDVDSINLVDMYSCYIRFGVASHIILNHTGHIDIMGLSTLCQPPFELITDVVRQYIDLADVDALDQFQYPDIESSPIRQLILRSTIRQVDSVFPGSIPYKLIKQYSGDIEYPLTIPYIMTIDGPIIASNFLHTIDTHYYATEMREAIQQLQQLKNYRGISQPDGCKNDV